MKSRHRKRRAQSETLQPPSGNEKAELGQAKRLFFSAIMVLFPVLLVVIMELVLRISHYGGTLDLVVKRSVGGHEFYSINRGVAQRYFAQSGVVTPEPSDDLFAVVKPATTKRIFCLGESTMAGFPYEFNATAPSFLRDRLQRLLPQYKIEVINVGLSAVGSYVVRDFIGKLLEYQPDLFVIYVGHNEFYGVYGVGSAVRGRTVPWLTRLNISLLNFRTFLLLRDLYGRIGGWFSSPPTQDANTTLMQQMVGNDLIPLDGELYRLGRRIYRDNLTNILKEAKGHGVPILVSALVSNVRDRPPFRGVFSEVTTKDRQREWQRLLDSADGLDGRGLSSQAVEVFSSAVALDSSNAIGYYRLGRQLLNAGRVDAAGQALLRAKDLDVLRFRMSEDFQADLREICRSLNVPVAPVDSAFQTASPNGIIGRELILEHLHPNIRGYFLMAKTWCQTIATSGLLAPPGEWDWTGDTTEAAFMSQSAVSTFDSLQGALKINVLTHRWPFTTQAEDVTFVPADGLERIVYQYVQKKIAWSDARYQLAEYYAGKNEYDNARRECFAVSKVIPFYYQPLLRIADYYRMQGKNGDAKQAYLRCIEVDDNPFARMKLAIILLEEERAAESASQIETALSSDCQKRHSLPIEALGTARYLLGVSYAKLGNMSQARDNLQRALSIQPGMGEARELLQQLPR